MPERNHPPLSANVDRFSGFAETYDTYRPEPPPEFVDLLIQLCEVDRPRLIVDLGSGTGLSTTLWAGRVDRIIGIEPNPDMRRQAIQRTSRAPDSAGIRYQDGLSTDTRLGDGCADIVTCSQSLHWMDPEPTFAEVARILRPGGVFASIDCDWPPVVTWEVEAAYSNFISRASALGQARGCYEGVRHWNKNQHLSRMQASGRFRYCREALMHRVESGGKDRLVGVALSQGSIATLLKVGLTEDEIGLTSFRAAASQLLGDGSPPWYFSYRVRIGVR